MAEHCSMLLFMMIHCSSYALWTDAWGMAPGAPGLGPPLLHGGDSFSFLNCDPGSDIIDPNTSLSKQALIYHICSCKLGEKKQVFVPAETRVRRHGTQALRCGTWPPSSCML
jgi:hypothetical protein